MLKYLVVNKYPIRWILFHLLLGASCTLSPMPIIIWFYLVIGSSLWLLVKSDTRFLWLTSLIVYAASFEMLARMSKTSPYVPYETGKYLIFVLLVFGILAGYRRGWAGWIMLLLLIPGIFIDLSGLVPFKSKIFNVMGAVNVALAVIYFKGQVITKENLIILLRLLIYPLIAVLAFVIIKTPDLDQVKFRLGANFETAGGFGTNQVSTALGLGAFLLFLFWKNRWEFTGFRWLDGLVFVLFVFRGLLTFSRGGMLGGLIGIFIILLFNKQFAPNEQVKKTSTNAAIILTAILFVILTFRYADQKTGGKLSLRYMGETSGTLSGSKKFTLNTFTTNRLGIFEDDFQLWMKYPVSGVGVGASVYLREKTKSTLSHIEASRLLSEHGFFGLLYIYIFCWLGYNFIRIKQFPDYKVILIALFTIAIFTTFHAAMRTFISPLLIGISFMLVKPDDVLS